GALYLGPERARVYSNLSPEDKERYNADIRIYTLINRYTDAKYIWDNVKMLLEGSELTKEDHESQLYDDFEQFRQNKGETIHDYYVRQDVVMQAQENRVVLDEEQLLFTVADECDAFDSDVDEAPTAQTMFMANLSFADPVYDKAGPSYDLDILSEVHDHDNYQDVVCEHHEVHEMHDDVQLNYVVVSDAEYTGDINMILYDQYVKDNTEPVGQNNVSFIPNDVYMMIINEIHEQPAQYVYLKAHTKVVDASLTAELATYKEQVKLNNREVHLDYLKHLKKSITTLRERKLGLKDL
nr:retrovirus-related Pol polyprotein from transposon TNT 1-94 [Tanacetum cinerariifolium]